MESVKKSVYTTTMQRQRPRVRGWVGSAAPAPIYEIKLSFAGLALGKRNLSKRHRDQHARWSSGFHLPLWWPNELVGSRCRVCRDVRRIRPEHHAGVSPAVLAHLVQGQVAGTVVHPHLRCHGDGELRARVVLGSSPPPQAHRRRCRSVQHPTWLPPRAHRLGGVPPDRR